LELHEGIDRIFIWEWIIPLMNTKRMHWWRNREPITLTTAIKTRNVHELNETGSLNTQGNLMTDSW